MGSCESGRRESPGASFFTEAASQLCQLCLTTQRIIESTASAARNIPLAHARPTANFTNWQQPAAQCGADRDRAPADRWIGKERRDVWHRRSGPNIDANCTSAGDIDTNVN
jgi:hypothetical protein